MDIHICVLIWLQVTKNFPYILLEPYSSLIIHDPKNKSRWSPCCEFDDAIGDMEAFDEDPWPNKYTQIAILMQHHVNSLLCRHLYTKYFRTLKKKPLWFYFGPQENKNSWSSTFQVVPLLLTHYDGEDVDAELFGDAIDCSLPPC